MGNGRESSSERCYTCLIVDDEPPARSELRTLVGSVPWLEPLGEARSGPEAAEMIDRLVPDLVFLDVRMPGCSGLDVLARTKHHPRVIFTTAHAEHAVTAFGLDALDYLLKPFGEERFAKAMSRAKRRLDAQARERHGEVLLDGSPTHRVFVRDRGRLIPIEAASIVRFEADGDYVHIHTSEADYLVYTRLKELEARMDSTRFVRVHRSHLVNLDHVEALVPHAGGRLRVRFRDGSAVVASRRRSKSLRDMVL
jgi:two-component system LytT family response regulator